MRAIIKLGVIGAVICGAALSAPARAASVGNYFFLITGDIRTPLAKGESLNCLAYVYLVPGAPPPAVGGAPNSVNFAAKVAEDGKSYACQMIIPYLHPTAAEGRQLTVGYSVTKSSAPGGAAVVLKPGDAASFKELHVPAVPAGPQLLPPVKVDL